MLNDPLYRYTCRVCGEYRELAWEDDPAKPPICCDETMLTLEAVGTEIDGPDGEFSVIWQPY